MKNTKKKGFTIVELVIVIAVIGILSAILIHTFSGLVKSAQETAVQENLRNAYVVYGEEAAKNGTYLDQEEVVFKVVEGTTTAYYKYSKTTGKYAVTTTATDYAVEVDLDNDAHVDVYNTYEAYTHA